MKKIFNNKDFKVVILAGGLGTRISEYTKEIPKPMVKILNKPLILYIMKHYAKFGFKNFYIAAGYKQEVLKKFFKKKFYDWNVKIIDTGQKTMTGGRIKRLKSILNNKPFFLTYGDSITDFDPISAYKKFKKTKHKFLISIYKYISPYGVVKYKKNFLTEYSEKKFQFYINAGFYIFKKEIFKFIKSKDDSLEKKIIPLILKKKKNKIIIYKCNFWHPMDNYQDRAKLSNILKK